MNRIHITMQYLTEASFSLSNFPNTSWHELPDCRIASIYTRVKGLIISLPGCIGGKIKYTIYWCTPILQYNNILIISKIKRLNIRRSCMSKIFLFVDRLPQKRNSHSLLICLHICITPMELDQQVIVLSRLGLALPSLDFQMILSSLPHKFL